MPTLKKILLVLSLFFISCGHLFVDRNFPSIGYLNSNEVFTEEEVIVKSLSIERGQIKLNHKVYFINGEFRIHPRQDEYVSPYKTIQIGDTVRLSSKPSRIEVIGIEGKRLSFTELGKDDESWNEEWW